MLPTPPPPISSHENTCPSLLLWCISHPVCASTSSKCFRAGAGGGGMVAALPGQRSLVLPWGWGRGCWGVGWARKSPEMRWAAPQGGCRHFCTGTPQPHPLEVMSTWLMNRPLAGCNYWEDSFPAGFLRFARAPGSGRGRAVLLLSPTCHILRAWGH